MPGAGASGSCDGPEAQGRADGQIVHGSVVAFEGAGRESRGVLITGPSGAGKSGLALQLMALGARLVADDRVVLHRSAGALIASAPDAIRGMIEARGVGLLRAEPLEAAQIVLVLDLGEGETARLPPPRRTVLLGVRLPLLHGLASARFPAAVKLYLIDGPAIDNGEV